MKLKPAPATNQLSFLLPLDGGAPPPEPEPAPEPIPISKPKGPTDPELAPLFEHWWWTRCWHREAKGHARKAFYLAIRNKGVTFDELCQGADRYAAFLQRNPSRPPKHPATWINAEGWADEYPDVDARSASRTRTAAFVAAAGDGGRGTGIRRRV